MNDFWSGRRVVVVGAGRSGVAAAGLLLQAGARVTITDSRTVADLSEELEAVTRRGADLALGGHPEGLWKEADAVVASPGIGAEAPPLVAARTCGVPILSEVELAAGFATAPCIAITGSNGKSTVTAMVGAILRAAGIEAPVCGNIGVPWSRVVAAAQRGEIAPQRYVLELSSFQTEAIERFRPHWSAILNLSPDHLDRHRTLAAYGAAKARIAANCTADDWLVYGADDPELAAALPAGPTPVPFGAAAGATGPTAWIDEASIHWRGTDGHDHEVVAREQLRVIGRHNALNAAAATALGCLAGADVEHAAMALRAFEGLEHRMELCGMPGGVRCINDSKATNVGATIAALSGVDDPAWLILGGRDKGADFGTLAPHLGERVRAVLLIGEASDDIEAALAGHVQLNRCGTLEAAVAYGLESAGPGEVLLLAPACTSFDAYVDFEERGRHFRTLIAAAAASD